MSENASHVIVHHYIENHPTFGCAGVACCVILVVFVVVLFLIVAGIVIFLLVYLTRHLPSKRPRRQQRQPPTTLHGYENNAIDDEASSCNAATAATSVERDDVRDDENDDNVAQSIPMTTFKSPGLSKRQDSSDSSAGLYEVLFPDRDGGGEEVLYHPPTKFLTFAGQVFAGPESVGSDAGPSGSVRDTDSMVWDYFQPTPLSDVEPEVDPGAIEDICWV